MALRNEIDVTAGDRNNSIASCTRDEIYFIVRAYFILATPGNFLAFFFSLDFFVTILSEVEGCIKAKK
jgi:hypothetical protein